MQSEATPAECRKMETLLRYLSSRTPNELTTPCETRIAAYIPIVLALGRWRLRSVVTLHRPALHAATRLQCYSSYFPARRPRLLLRVLHR